MRRSRRRLWLRPTATSLRARCEPTAATGSLGTGPLVGSISTAFELPVDNPEDGVVDAVDAMVVGNLSGRKHSGGTREAEQRSTWSWQLRSSC